MDKSERKITKIARTSEQFVSILLKDTGLGLSEYELLHYVRHHKGCNQNEICLNLHQDKAAVARRIANLVKKGYLYTEIDENDRRGKKVFATTKADAIQNSKKDEEAFYYEWLLSDVDSEELSVFLKVLDEIYRKSKMERKQQYQNVLLARKEEEYEKGR